MTSALLVEDDERVRRFVIRGLESEGYRVIEGTLDRQADIFFKRTRAGN